MSFDSTGFDDYAAEYEAALTQGISISGENKDYFARRRISWLRDCIAKLGERPERILDFGCGTGSATPFFVESIEGASVLGIDVSSKSLDIAKRLNASLHADFMLMDQYVPRGEISLAFCNGVFHHIPKSSRKEAVRYIYRALRPGGLFAFWENNPWNPATRYVMSRIPFDRDAVPITPPDARALLRSAGFEVIGTHFLFIFPRVLRLLRRFEPTLSNLPLGAQYQVFCRKSSTAV